MDLARVVTAVVVGVVTGIVVYLVGLLLVEVNVENVGNFVKEVSGLLGLLAGLGYLLTGRRAV